MATTSELIERLRAALAAVEPAVLEALDERISQGREVPFGELARSERRERRSKVAGARIESSELVSIPLTEDEVFGLTAQYLPVPPSELRRVARPAPESSRRSLPIRGGPRLFSHVATTRLDGSGRSRVRREA